MLSNHNTLTARSQKVKQTSNIFMNKYISKFMEWSELDLLQVWGSRLGVSNVIYIMSNFRNHFVVSLSRMCPMPPLRNVDDTCRIEEVLYSMSLFFISMSLGLMLHILRNRRITLSNVRFNGHKFQVPSRLYSPGQGLLVASNRGRS